MLRLWVQYTLIYFFCISVFTAMAAHAETRVDACPSPIYYIEGIDVSSEAETSASARQVAGALGLEKAWGLLKARLLLPSQGQKPNGESAETPTEILRDLIDYIRIDQETVLPRRYIGRQDYCFDRQKTRAFFKAQSLRHAELRSGAILVLPVWNFANKPQLWRRPNPWAAAWRGVLDGRGGLVDLRLAEGLSVERGVGVAAILRGERDEIAKAATLAEVERVIITILTPKITDSAASLNVEASLYDRNGKFESTVYRLDNMTSSLDRLAATLDWLAEDMARGVENVWRTTNVMNTEDSGVIMLNISADSIQHWSRQIAILAGLAPVDRLDVVQLSAKGGIVRLQMVGSLTSLNYALESHLLTLEERRIDAGEIPLKLVPLRN